MTESFTILDFSDQESDCLHRRECEDSETTGVSWHVRLGDSKAGGCSESRVINSEPARFECR